MSKRKKEKDFLVAVYAYLPREVIRACIFWNQDHRTSSGCGAWMLKAVWYCDGRKTGCDVQIVDDRFPEWERLCVSAEVFATVVSEFLERSLKMETV